MVSKHVSHRNTLLLGLDAVKVDVQLRHVNLVMENTAEFRCLGGCRDEGVSGRIQFGIADSAAILELHLEAADRTQAKHGTGAEKRRRRLPGSRVFLPERPGDCASREFRAAPFSEWFQHNVDDNPPLELLVKPLIDLPGKATALSTPGWVSADFRSCGDHRLGTIERSAVWQLRESDQELLILGRYETAGEQVGDADGKAEQHGVDAHRLGFAADDAGDATTVVLGSSPEETVERGEESAQVAVHLPRQPVRPWRRGP